MKKILSLALVSMLTLGSAYAQQSIGGTVNKPKKETISNPEESANSYNFSDIGITFNTDDKRYGIGFGGDLGKSGYFNMSFGVVDSNFSSAFGLGLQKRALFADNLLMLQGRAVPYLTYYTYDSYDSRGNETSKSKFSYGLDVSIVGGIKLFTTKKGKLHFLTIGYYMGAPEFKFDNIVDNGSWQIGWTIAFPELF